MAGFKITFETPLTAFVITSFTALKPSLNCALAGKISKIFSLSISIHESTLCINFDIPALACSALFSCSYLNGVVTTATVRIPSSLATFAITGEPPVPVPPPIPATIKSISVCSSASLISGILSSAAILPFSGSFPAPKPFVNSWPNLIFFAF